MYVIHHLANNSIGSKTNYSLDSNMLIILSSQGKKIMSASCSSNKADTIDEAVGANGSGQKVFSCTCSGQGSYTSFAAGDMICSVIYTECPLIS